MKLKNYRLFGISFCIALGIVLLKYGTHALGWEVITLGSLHTSVIAGTFFVVGFLLSATIADYKESEKIPAEFSATVENMAEDAAMIHKRYGDFDVLSLHQQLARILKAFKNDVRDKTRTAHEHIHDLHTIFSDMEKAGVPANFIVKFKQEQAQLVKSLFRVSYIQRITFLPSATILTRSLVVLAIGILVFTEIEPFYGGMALTGCISFIIVYILKLIRLISTPFHGAGKTQDDVSMFLVDEAAERIEKMTHHQEESGEK